MDYLKIHGDCEEANLFGRYIHLEHIEPVFLTQKRKEKVKILGYSVQKKPIYSYQIGRGKTKILIWSQMHGNESTTTKAIFDLFNFLDSESGLQSHLLEKFSLCFVPILNPDGAKLYTRENANGIDLNRDAQDLSQPESKILKQLYEDFNPDFCYNLHDQRTIYGVGDTNKSATVSFLAPSFDVNRTINATRNAAINIIVAINEVLQKYIPGQIGRYDDGFNINCVGDAFQYLGTPTVLFESGHYANDYNREETRKYIFIALLSSLNYLNEIVVVYNKIQDYLNIPQNKSSFFDIVYKNIQINYDKTKINTSFAIQFTEELLNNNIFFNGFIVKIGNLENNFGHLYYDAEFKNYSDDFNNYPILDEEANFCLDKTIKIKNGVVNNS